MLVIVKSITSCKNNIKLFWSILSAQMLLVGNQHRNAIHINFLKNTELSWIEKCTFTKSCYRFHKLLITCFCSGTTLESHITLRITNAYKIGELYSIGFLKFLPNLNIIYLYYSNFHIRLIYQEYAQFLFSKYNPKWQKKNASYFFTEYYRYVNHRTYFAASSTRKRYLLQHVWCFI